jgi:hypothetical protein
MRCFDASHTPLKIILFLIFLGNNDQDKVILQQIESKDYRDIAALIEAAVSLPRALAAARKMYGKQFQPIECLKAMTYFEGGDLDSLTQTEKKILIQAAGNVRDLPEVEIISRHLAFTTLLPAPGKSGTKSNG